jgi:hypothetical protein
VSGDLLSANTFLCWIKLRPIFSVSSFISLRFPCYVNYIISVLGLGYLFIDLRYLLLGKNYICKITDAMMIANCQKVELRRSRGFPPRRPGFKSGSGHVGFCDGQKWRWGRFSPKTSVSPANLRSICFSRIIFTITRGWHNRPGVAAVPIASQTRIKKN